MLKLSLQERVLILETKNLCIFLSDGNLEHLDISLLIILSLVKVLLKVLDYLLQLVPLAQELYLDILKLGLILINCLLVLCLFTLVVLLPLLFSSLNLCELDCVSFNGLCQFDLSLSEFSIHLVL